jgi:uncharacterized lipoprotein YbaY
MHFCVYVYGTIDDSSGLDRAVVDQFPIWSSLRRFSSLFAGVVQVRGHIMMKRIRNVVPILLMVGLLAACASTSMSNSGPTQTEQVRVALPGDTAQEQAVDLKVNAGELDLTPGSEGLLQGTIEYNLDKLKPVINTSGNRTEVRNGDMTPTANAKNSWKMRIGQGVPLNLDVTTGAATATADLGGLTLRSLKWTQGAGEQTIQFSKPNQGPLNMFMLEHDAGKASIRGLSNAQIVSAVLKAVAGELTIYADGALTTDSSITIDSTTAGVTIYSAGAPVRVTAQQEVGSLDAGSWARVNGAYESPEWAKATGPKMTIDITSSTGQISLK